MTTEKPTLDDHPQSQEHSWFDEILTAAGNAATQRLNFSPASIQVIERHHATPAPLEQLLHR